MHARSVFRGVAANPDARHRRPEAGVGAAPGIELAATHDLGAAKRLFGKMLQDQPSLTPDRIGTDGPGRYPLAIVPSPGEPAAHRIMGSPRTGAQS